MSPTHPTLKAIGGSLLQTFPSPLLTRNSIPLLYSCLYKGQNMTLSFAPFLPAFLIQQPVDAHAVCDLGFPGVCFALLSPLNYSALCCREATASNTVATTWEVTAHFNAPGISAKVGIKRTAHHSFLIAQHNLTLQTAASDPQRLCLWLRGQHSARKAFHGPGERCTTPASSTCTGMKGLGFSLGVLFSPASVRPWGPLSTLSNTSPRGL